MPSGPILKVVCHYPEMPLPSRGHPGDAGLDLTAMAVTEVRPGVFSVDTGLSVQPPPGFYCEVVARSSIVHGDFILANAVGVIDPDYRGRVLILLRHLGAGSGVEQAQALKGKRVAQLLLRRLELAEVQVVAELDITARGAGGFGSTGA